MNRWIFVLFVMVAAGIESLAAAGQPDPAFISTPASRGLSKTEAVDGPGASHVAPPVVAACSSADDLSRCRRIENDIERLACFDKVVQVAAQAVPEAPLTREEQIRRAVDSMLARDLVDPTSAIGYEVSDPLPCRSIEPLYKEPTHQCVCYSVNSKNRMGGYSGATLRAASVVESPGFVFAMGGLDVRTAEGMRACGAANLSERAASFIADRVKR